MAEKTGAYEKADALGLFGATGDLAHRKIFPAVHELVKTGRLTVPVIAVARGGLTREQLLARSKDGMQKRLKKFDEGVFRKLADGFKTVDGDYQDPKTFAALREALGPACKPLYYL